MTNSSSNSIRAAILERHGCEVVPAAYGKCVIQPKAHLRRGDLLDRKRVAACRADLEAAGISTDGWLS